MLDKIEEAPQLVVNRTRYHNSLLSQLLLLVSQVFLHQALSHFLSVDLHGTFFPLQLYLPVNDRVSIFIELSILTILELLGHRKARNCLNQVA